MNKGELVTAVAAKTGLTKVAAANAIETVFETIGASLAGGDRVQIVGFGTFEVHQRKAREGVKPGTNEKVSIPAMKVPVFKAGKALKDAVR